MKKIIFKCGENMNEFEEEREFEDDATEKEISVEWIEWVLEQVLDNYTWYEVDK